MSAFSTYSLVNFAWLGLQAAPLIVWPSFISSLLRPEYQNASSLENYFARSLGLGLLIMGLLLVLLSGAMPLISSSDAAKDEAVEGASPFAAAAAFLSTLHHTATGCHCYARWVHTGQTAFLLSTVVSATLALAGLACLLFVGDKTRLSKKGFDKNTSGFPFSNKESYRAKKKAL